MPLRQVAALFSMELDKRSVNNVSRTISSLKKGLGALGAAVSVGAVGVFLERSVNAASELVESINVLNITIGKENAKAVQAFAKNFSAATGRAQKDLVTFSSGFAAILQSTLGDDKLSTEFSNKLTEIGVDLASVFNTSDARAVEAVKSGILGISKPLKAFGVDLNIARLENDRLALGFKGSFKDLTAARKAQVRYNAIVMQSSAFAGDATNTSKEYAGSVKRLGSAFTDFQTELGEKLMPAANEFLNDFLIPATHALKGMIPVVKVLGNNFKFFSAAIQSTLDPAFILVAALGAMLLKGTAVVTMLKAAALATAPAWLLVALAIVAVVLAIDELQSFIDDQPSILGDIVAGFKDWNTQIKDLVGWVDSLTRQLPIIRKIALAIGAVTGAQALFSGAAALGDRANESLAIRRGREGARRFLEAQNAVPGVPAGIARGGAGGGTVLNQTNNINTEVNATSSDPALLGATVSGSIGSTIDSAGKTLQDAVSN